MALRCLRYLPCASSLRPSSLRAEPRRGAASHSVASAAMNGAVGTSARLAVAQMCSGGDTEANLAACERLAGLASRAGCALLCLPECCTFLGERDVDALSVAEPLPEGGPLLRRLQELARSHNLWLSLGGVPEASSTPQRRYNTHVVLSNTGQVVAAYRKLHLFDLEIPASVSLRESNVTLPGASVAPSVASPVGALGLAVCYDLRFPEVFTALRHTHGAQVILLPAAFTRPTGEAHWETLLRARAIETQCFLAAAAQCGQHNAKRASHGHACIIDPWGTVLARVPEGPDVEGIAVAEVDLRWLRTVRERMPIDAHRRADVYVTQ